MRPAAVSCLAIILAACTTLPEPTRYSNPLLGHEFADPAIVRAPEGVFYAYASQGAPGGRTFNIQVARSADLVAWEVLGDALPQKPAWGRTKQWFWAPHVLYDAQRRLYFMYYSAEPDLDDGKCLAVATSVRPDGPFADAGTPLACGPGIEHIDPMAFDDPQTGRRLLYWGSGRKPLKVQELAEDRLRFLPGSAPADILHPDPARNYSALIEAPWIVHRDGMYYLFYSGGLCCGPRARYAVLVARAASATGPFEQLPAAILERNDAWLAPGHPAIAQDDAGEDWLVYHAVDAPAAARSGRHAGQGAPRVLMMDRLTWRDGWPRIDSGAPSSAPRDAPRVYRSGATQR